MPKDAGIDWETAKALRQQGLGYATIAERLNCNASTVRSKAFRDKWDETVAKAHEILKQHPLTIEERAKNWTNDMLGVCEKKLAHLKGIEPSKLSPKDLQLMSQVLRTIDDLSRRTLGLDNEQPKTFHVGLVQNVAEIIVDPRQCITRSPSPVEALQLPAA